MELLILFMLTAIAFILIAVNIRKSSKSRTKNFQSNTQEEVMTGQNKDNSPEKNEGNACNQYTNKKGKLFEEQYTQNGNGHSTGGQSYSRFSDSRPEHVPSKFRNGYLGIARNIELRKIKLMKDSEEEILALRLEILDTTGNIVQVIPVEVRAKEISGRIMEGDKIIVKGRIRRNRILKSTAVLNLKTNEIIKSGKSVSLFGTTMGCLFGLIFTASVIGLIAGIAIAIDDESGILLIIASVIGMILSIYFVRKNRGF